MTDFYGIFEELLGIYPIAKNIAKYLSFADIERCIKKSKHFKKCFQSAELCYLDFNCEMPKAMKECWRDLYERCERFGYEKEAKRLLRYRSCVFPVLKRVSQHGFSSGSFNRFTKHSFSAGNFTGLLNKVP